MRYRRRIRSRRRYGRRRRSVARLVIGRRW